MAALLFSILSILFLPFYIATAVIVALVTLHKDSKEGLIVMVWALTPIIAIIFAIDLHLASLIIIFNYLTIWGLASVLRRYRAWNMILELAAVAGVFALFMVGQLFPEIYSTIGIAVATFFKVRQKVDGFQLNDQEFQQWVQWLSLLTMGFAVLQLLMVNIISLILARAWQAKCFNQGGFIQEFKAIRVGKLLSLVLIVAVIFSLFDFQFSLEMIPILMLPYFFDALSLIHHTADNNPNKPAILGFLYLSCFIFYTLMFFGLTIVGIVDSWYDFRKKTVLQ